jgi:hypothetical protein
VSTPFNPILYADMAEHTHHFEHWPFPDDADTISYCTGKVAHENFPVRRVTHDHDGDWQFLDATTDDPGEPVLVCLGCVFERDATLSDIADLPRGWCAYRAAIGEDWECWEKPLEADEDDEHE